jgi:hypothetical protein
MTRRTAKLAYHLVRVTCSERTDGQRVYVAGLIDEHRRGGIICAACGLPVPHGGNAAHAIAPMPRGTEMA